MIRTVANVIRGEGMASALRRAAERVGEAAGHAASRAASLFAGRADFAIVNVSSQSIAPRSGGVAVQLMARLRAERALRSVALLHPRGLWLSTPFAHTRRVRGVREAIAITGATAVHIEGTSGVDLAGVLRLIESGTRVVVSVHDFTLLGAPLGRQLLESATGVIFPSQFLLDRHEVNGSVIAPASGTGKSACPTQDATGIAYAGSVKRHKGAQLLPEVAAMLGARGITLHVFGGGDADLLRPLRRCPNVVIHGYYRCGALPSLLARHAIGLVVLPSIVPEAYSLTLSEAWLGGAAVAAFDLGAPAERIRRDGGGWLAPPESGPAGLVAIVDRWRSGERSAIPPVVASPAAAARAHVALYRQWGFVE